VVVELLKSAANDPDVLAIKQTLYRTGGSSPVIGALTEAARNGKHVTAVIELKARFDEANNMSWAKELQKAGVNVVFGFVELKTHTKACLIIRREKDKMVHYCHLSTGNYNHQSAKIYTDIGFFTCDQKIGKDVALMFNLITGVNIFKRGKTKQIEKDFKSIFIAPLNMRSQVLSLIDDEIASAQQGKKAEVVAKMNSLVDLKTIDKLYEASQAGVVVKLMVRGMCCLVPGVQGLSDNIQVKSVVGRFLEHSRVFTFHAGGKLKVYLSSADWMPRNFDRRVEIMWPVNDQKLKVRLLEQILEVSWKDNTNTRNLLPSGEYRHEKKGSEPFSSHLHFVDEARSKGIKLYPYEQQPNVIKNIAKLKK
jgi:polyphosphate kinase